MSYIYLHGCIFAMRSKIWNMETILKEIEIECF